MAITASYNRPNDYNVVNFQPYELDYDSVLKEAATKQQYWLQGVAKVQEGWKQVSDLDPLYSQNKKELESFNKSAKEEISKLSKTDLSLSENSNKIKDIISPLYDSNNKTGRTILLDSQLNKFYKSEFAKAEGYKTSNKGEGYNYTNEVYLRAKYQDYANGKDNLDPNLENKLKRSWDTKEGYTPYYDYSKERENIIKGCKADNLSYTSFEYPGYVTQTTDNSLLSSKLQGCLYSSFSDKAKNQIRKEGYVNYLTSEGKNLIGLGQDFTRNGVKLVEGKVSENLKLFNEIEKNKELLKKATSQEQKDYYSSSIEHYNSLMEYNEKQITDITDDITAIQSNPSLLEKEFDRYTGTLHLNNVIGGIASSYSNVNKVSKTIPDTYQIFMLNMHNSNNKWNAEQKLKDERDALAYQRDLNKIALKGEIDLEIAGSRGRGKGKGKGEDEYGNVILPEDNIGESLSDKEPFNYENFKNQKNELKASILQTDEKYYSILRSSQLGKYVNDEVGEKNFTNKYANYSPENFKLLKELVSGVGGSKLAKDQLLIYNDISEENKSLKETYDNIEYNIYKKTVKAFGDDKTKYNVTLKNGTVVGFTLNDFLNLKNGITQKSEFVKGLKPNIIPGLGMFGAKEGDFEKFPYYYNGEKITFPKEAVEKYKKVMSENYKKYNKSIDVYKEEDYLLSTSEEVHDANSIISSLNITQKDYNLIAKTVRGIKFAYSGAEDLTKRKGITKLANGNYLYAVSDMSRFNLPNIDSKRAENEKAAFEIFEENADPKSLELYGRPYVDSKGIKLYLVYNNKVNPPSWDIYQGRDDNSVLSGNGVLVKNFEGEDAAIMANRAFRNMKNNKL